MLQALAFCHAEHAALRVLLVERLVLEFRLEDRPTSGCLYTAALDEHAGHDAVEFGVSVGDFLAVGGALEPSAEGDEVLAGLGRQVAEEFKHDLLSHAFARDVHVSELAGGRGVKGIDLALDCDLFVMGRALLNLVSVVVQRPLRERLRRPDVVTVVQHDQALVLWVIVKHTL